MAARPSSVPTTSSASARSTLGSSATTTSSGSAATTDSSASQSHATSHLTGGAITGITVGCIAVVAAIIALVAFLFLRHKRSNKDPHVNSDGDFSDKLDGDHSPSELSPDTSQCHHGPVEIDSAPINPYAKVNTTSSATDKRRDDMHHGSTKQGQYRRSTHNDLAQLNIQRRSASYGPSTTYSSLSEISAITSAAGNKSPLGLQDSFSSPQTSPAFSNGFRSSSSPIHLSHGTFGQSDQTSSLEITDTTNNATSETIHEAPEDCGVPDFSRDRVTPTRPQRRYASGGYLSPEQAMSDGFRDI
ncbi:hypothetical protein FH972_023348 [Carpinus fangiana]|uniref:Uncharacterized protein n=1 Tax=Carpinus fangiana TaxID=176857 RepID=A0A5N6KVF5_9ROSI|nr:hypothetical protein FH972_023348 [Carpinus fangiana]